MAKRASLDANALLRLILGDVPAQSDAVLKLLSQDMVFDVADMVIAEVLYVLESSSYGFSRQQSSQAIRRVTEEPRFSCNRQMFQKALTLYEDHPALSFVDCCAVTYAELNEATALYTFDKKLAGQSGKLAKLIG